MKLGHISLRVSDLSRSLSFYRALGFKEKRRIELEKFRSTLVFLQADNGAELELVFNWDDTSPPELGNGFLHLGLEVEDLEQFLSRLRSGGITGDCQITTTPQGDKICFLTDPDGYQIELIEPKAK